MFSSKELFGNLLIKKWNNQGSWITGSLCVMKELDSTHNNGINQSTIEERDRLPKALRICLKVDISGESKVF